jgi:hypothetical protein
VSWSLLNRREEFELDLGFHRIPFVPGLSRSSAVPSPGVASWAQRHLRINIHPPLCDAVLPEGGRGYEALTPVPLPKFPRRARTLILPCECDAGSCPISDLWPDIRLREQADERTFNLMVTIRRVVWRGWPDRRIPIQVCGFTVPDNRNWTLRSSQMTA